MRPLLCSVALVLFALVMAACGSPEQQPVARPESSEADAAAIRQLLDNHVQAINGGRVEAALQSWAPDAIVMRSGLDPYGFYELQELAHKGAGSYSQDLTWRLDEVVAAGDWAFVRGAESGTLTPEDADPIEMDSNFLLVLRRQPDGSWKIARSIGVKGPRWGS